MAFSRITAPTKIGRIAIHIYSELDPNDATGATVLNPTGAFELQLLDANLDIVKSASGNLAPQLTATQQQQILNLMQALRAKATSEAL